MLDKKHFNNFKDVKLCVTCELINSERIPLNWVVHHVEPKECECCKGE